MKVEIENGVVYWIDVDRQYYLLEDFVWQDMSKQISVFADCYWMVLK